MPIDPNAAKEIDAYIADAPKFAQPICKKLRALVHKADPEIVEDWKWGPNFNRDGMVCGFGAAKAHVTLTFFQGAALKDAKKILAPCSEENARNRSIKFTSVDEIDEKTLTAYVKEAALLNVNGIKAPTRRAEIPMPDDLDAALRKSAKSKKFWDGLTPGYKREYIDWAVSAKRPETRTERIATIVEWCGEGKTRHWKYQKS